MRDIFSPALAGSDPCDVGACLISMNRALKQNPFAKAAVEMALWDIAGKAAGIVWSMGSNLELGSPRRPCFILASPSRPIDSETYPGDFLGPLYH